jgi:hypothetical protein
MGLISGGVRGGLEPEEFGHPAATHHNVERASPIST